MASNNELIAKTGLFDNGYALVVGIANYRKVRKLPPIVLKDAQDISVLLRSPEHCGYPTDQVKHLVDDLATANEIRTGLRWLAEQTSKDDTAVFFFSGHGGRLVEGGLSDNYLLPIDVNPADLVTTALGGEEITTLLQAIPAGRLLAIFDCCHAGGIGDLKALDDKPGWFKSGVDEAFYSYLSEGKGRAILASSRADEVSWVLPDLENSLFTHYLLKALQGEAPTRGDGRIRVFDIFDYVSEQVPERQSSQHPLFKAQLENNFPVALYQGQKVISTVGKPHIQNIKGLALSTVEHEVLEKMFAGYERLTLKREFGKGFSGGRVFLVRPIPNTREAELPAVVKTGPIELIQQEKHAFSDLIQHKLPNAIWVVDRAISQDRGWAGLRYPLAGDGRFTIESLKDYIRHAPVEDVLYVLQERLFRSLRPLWQKEQASEFYWRDSYDYLLPVNLFIEADASIHDKQPNLTPTSIGHVYEPGTQVTLQGFRIIEVDAESKTVTLTLPLSSGQQIVAPCYRLRIAVEEIDAYQAGEILSEPLTGRIRDTRRTLLQNYATAVLNHDIDIAAKEISLAEGVRLPNPIEGLPSLLERTTDVPFSSVHGDLNLENVLVEYDSQNRNVHLIDFASTRKDHMLHDLLRLESGILLYMLPHALKAEDLPATAIISFFEALHQGLLAPTGLERSFAIVQAIREEARRHLDTVGDGEWTQYYEGLVIYLLSALKYSDFDKEETAPLPKQVAFWGAAALQNLVHGRTTELPIGKGLSLPITRDLVLHFERCEEGYQVRGHSTLIDRMPTVRLKELSKKLAIYLHQNRNSGSQKIDIEILGQTLYEAVFSPMHPILQDFLSLSSSPKPRLILDFSQTPNLQVFPWEILYNGEQFLTDRLLRFAGPGNATIIEPVFPLRVLITGHRRIEGEEEGHRIEKILDSLADEVEVSVKPQLSIDGFLHTLGRASSLQKPYHIWHHIGPVSNEKSVRLVFGSPGRKQSIEFEQLSQRIQEVSALHLVYLDLHQTDAYPTALPVATSALDVPATVVVCRPASPASTFFARDFYQGMFSSSLHQTFASSLLSFMQRDPGVHFPFWMTRDLESPLILVREKGRYAEPSKESEGRPGKKKIEVKTRNVRAQKILNIGDLANATKAQPMQDIEISLDTEDVEADVLAQIGSADAAEYFESLLDFLND